MKYFFAFILLVYACGLVAQVPATWGTKVGMNLSQHYGTKGDAQDYDVKTGLRPGFIGGVYLDLAATENLSLVFESLFSMKGSRETITIKSIEIDGVMEDLAQPAQMKVKYYMDYVELPVLLKLKTIDKAAFSLSALTGTAMSLKVNGHHELDGVVFFPSGDGEYSEIPIHETSDLGDVNMFDFSFVYGGELLLKSRIPLKLEYRFTLGWDYLLLPTYEFFEPVQLRNQTWSVLLGTTF